MEAAVHGTLFTLFGTSVTSEVTTMWGIMLVILVLFALGNRRIGMVPSGAQNVLEWITEGIIDVVITPSIGSREKAVRYLPFLGSFFIFILASNYVDLLPGNSLVPGLKAPTSSLSVPATLAAIGFLGTQYAGFREKGFAYLRHFIQPTPLMLPLNIIEEIIRPVSLALRLFGNIFGEETILLVLLSLVPYFVPVPMMALVLLFSLLQAFIFTTLVAVYIGSATGEGH